ncbi:MULTISPECIES: sigma-54-dependent transcriptional regulator [unclassified Rhizobium]|uniref:sigma-54-dependent transcriptional regulator n=1 Tax=unclassified Rhizobium TaxID=2613769 RepID=UPI0007161394|nr:MULTISPECIES: sigma-54 dependent transcriptional regulator [unclassified Rhizobium]KQS89722.1 Fis family transcriptional regulator [Rhizobium sp. Leaf391]KQS95002.1 Fis family transcriptional regulator [Rhizobium sp. Leaf386]KQU01378.1 Fis family transcriptional regulator [Rhizobium sp. Leaf453]
MTSQILVIDDDPVQRRLLTNMIERLGHIAHLADNGRSGLELLERKRGLISVILLDLMMPEMNGHGFLEAIAERGIDTPVIVQTGQGGIETVVLAMQAGAFDFVVKPVSPERLSVAIGNALKLEHREGKGRAPKRSRSGSVGFDDVVSASPAMIRVLDLARRAAQSNIPIVLEGESGVGKEMVARSIQHASERAGKPFITVNCGAIPHNLVESILFGHEKGAFTGANEKHSGKFADADGGTLFLDEIGDLPLEVQVKLLRAVQQGEIETIGARHPQKVNVRLISATNKDLINEVREGRFREDLYYRLNVFPIAIPALRKRKEDIPVLVRTFVERFAIEQRLATPLTVSSGAMALLTAYDWPGNIRQLENAIFRAVVLAEGTELTVKDFPQIATQIPGYVVAEKTGFTWEETGPARMPIVEADHLPSVYPQFGSPERHDARSADHHHQPDNAIASVDDGGNVRKLADVEEELIRFALKFYRGQMSQVARKLGIGRSTLYRKLKDYGINPDDPFSEAA